MVAEVVPAERLLAAAIEYAQTIAEFAPVALRLAKQAVRSAEELPVSAALAHEKSLLATALATDDHREGIDAFLARRAPRFDGR